MAVHLTLTRRTHRDKQAVAARQSPTRQLRRTVMPAVGSNTSASFTSVKNNLKLTVNVAAQLEYRSDRVKVAGCAEPSAGTSSKAATNAKRSVFISGLGIDAGSRLPIRGNCFFKSLKARSRFPPQIFRMSPRITSPQSSIVYYDLTKIEDAIDSAASIEVVTDTNVINTLTSPRDRYGQPRRPLWRADPGTAGEAFI